MSGLSFSERVKLLLQKRLDHPKWPIGDSPPSAIRYLSDGQGNLMCILTTSVNPNDTAPIGPGSAEAAGEVDPLAKYVTGLEWPFTLTKKTNPLNIGLFALGDNVNKYMTFEKFATDYQVPAGKVFEMTKFSFYCSAAAVELALGYGSNGVAFGSTEPADPNYTSAANSIDQFTALAADVYYVIDIYFEVPASQYPFLVVTGGTGLVQGSLYGIERDA